MCFQINIINILEEWFWNMFKSKFKVHVYYPNHYKSHKKRHQQ